MVKISQEQIIKLLEKNKEMTCEELAEELKISSWAVAQGLTRLLKSGEVERTSKTKEQVMKENKHFTNRSYLWRLTNE